MPEYYDRQRNKRRRSMERKPRSYSRSTSPDERRSSKKQSKKKKKKHSSSSRRSPSTERSRSRRSHEQEDRKTKRRRSRSRSRSRSNNRKKGSSSTSSSSAQIPSSRTGDTTKIDTRVTTSKLQTSEKEESSSKMNDEEEKEKRRQRLKAWQASRKKVVTKISDSSATGTGVVSKSKLWKVDDDNQSSERPSISDLQQQQQNASTGETLAQKTGPAEDPLEAFMKDIKGHAIEQEFFGSHHSVAQRRTPKPSKIVTLEEVEQYQNETHVKENSFGSFLKPEGIDNHPEILSIQSTDTSSDTVDRHDAPYGGLTPGRVIETEEERDAREDREHREFMEAIKRKAKIEENGGLLPMLAEEEPLAVTKTATKKQDTLGRIFQGTDEDATLEDANQNRDNRTALEILQEAQKKKDIKQVDHSKIKYLAFRKKFYIVPQDIKALTAEQLSEIRTRLEIKIRGKGCPNPIEKWTQCGFSQRMLRIIKKLGYQSPFAIQCQGLPAIMSGRDVIGIAKTGSGKTLAFLLPMFRHILDQPPLGDGEGPIGLIMAPARELAQQIYGEAKKFSKDLGMRATAVYGGSSVSDQIANLKRGSDIVICTPGRMIDILTMNAGKLISLQRVTYVVLDEADRMFDMGFEPQISKILANIRKDRQTLLFSATFPRSVESLARKALTKPVEITVGTRSTASGDITQYVEVREEKDKFMRLLQLLGTWYEKGNVLVFVNTQQACDQLFQQLMKAGYPPLSLHGGKDQMDRDYTVDDFKRKVRTLMVATSVAGRGLDVKDLVLVINYHCPNHLEDYVHRVGRTGRAGRKGTAYTFISPEEEEYAPDLVKALESAKQKLPQELLDLNEQFKDKVKRGEARYHGSGFKGKGYTFDESEKTDAQKLADLQRHQYEIDQGIIDPYAGIEDEVGETKDGDASSLTKPKSKSTSSSGSSINSSSAGVDAATMKAQQIAMMLDRGIKKKKIEAAEKSGKGHFVEELEINDYPQQARWKVTQKESLDAIVELTGAAIIGRGSFVPQGRKPNPGERKLYLVIEGSTPQSVQGALRELQRILDETTLQVGLGGEKYGKYSL